MKMIEKTRWASLTAILLLLVSLQSSAGQRTLYIGDVVDLVIDGTTHTRRAIEEAFADMEILSLVQEDDTYYLSVRTEKVGRQLIRLDQEEIVFDVTSTLDVYDREDVFAADLEPIKGGWLRHLRETLYVFLGLMFLSGGWMLWRFLRHRKSNQLRDNRSAIDLLYEVPLNDENCLPQLGYGLKAYLSHHYQLTTQGLTGQELIEVVSSLPLEENMKIEMMQWLETCERYKYSGQSTDPTINQSLLNRLVAFIEAMDQSREVAR